MESDTNNALTDDQMQVDFRSDPTYMVGAIREMLDLEGRLKGRGDDEEITDRRTQQQGAMSDSCVR